MNMLLYMMVRVVPIRKAAPLSELAVDVGGARIVVRDGFDAVLLRQVVVALEAAR